MWSATRAGRAAMVAALLFLSAGCTAEGHAEEQAPMPKVVAADVFSSTPATLHPGDQVLVPTGRVVLRLSGLISQHNSRQTLALDLDTLAAMGTQKVRYYDVWGKRTVVEEGVWLEDLLAVAGVSKSAHTLTMTALDDYRITLDVADIGSHDALLTFRTEAGGDIAVVDGGPTRLVFAKADGLGKQNGLWIWSLATVEVS